MPNFDPSTLAAIAFINRGARVDRAAATTDLLFTTAAVPLFNVLVGRVLELAIVGEVTVEISNDATLAKWTGTPTAGTAVDLCANSATLAQAAVGKLLVMTGTLATAMTIANAGGALWQVTSHIIAPGTIDITGSVQGVTGAVKFSLWYLPLDDGAYVTAT
jgi:hypothetical protein